MKSIQTSILASVVLIIFAALPVSGQDAMVVEGNNVGVGTATPAVALHVVRSSGGTDLTMFRLENNGGNRFDFINSLANFGGHWQFVNTSGSAGADLVIRELVHNANEEFRLTESGNLTLSGEIFTVGACSSGCDRIFLPEYGLESIEEHAEYMWRNRHLPGVGPTPEGERMNLSRKTTGILNELEKAHIYIDELHGEIENLQTRLARLEALLEER